MNQQERRIYLIQELLKENKAYREMKIPETSGEQKQLLRGLMNIRMPGLAGEEFLKIQDEYLQEEIRWKGITETDSLVPVRDGIYLWQGDITTLRCDAIVNAANSQMLGCFCPNHGCIDNAIHTFSGIQLRAACGELMKEQGHEEKTGEAKITPAFNLPCKYVLHTVGPIIRGKLTDNDKRLLASCYRSCLELADKNHVIPVYRRFIEDVSLYASHTGFHGSVGERNGLCEGISAASEIKVWRGTGDSLACGTGDNENNGTV